MIKFGFVPLHKILKVSFTAVVVLHLRYEAPKTSGFGNEQGLCSVPKEPGFAGLRSFWGAHVQIQPYRTPAQR